jgi:hypothetical protein
MSGCRCPPHADQGPARRRPRARRQPHGFLVLHIPPSTRRLRDGGATSMTKPCCLSSGLRALAHNRRCRNSTGSAPSDRALQEALRFKKCSRSTASSGVRGLSPPVRILTDPGAHLKHTSRDRAAAGWPGSSWECNGWWEWLVLR